MQYEAVWNEFQTYLDGKHAREKVVEFVQDLQVILNAFLTQKKYFKLKFE